MTGRSSLGIWFIFLFGAICALGPMSIDMSLPGIPNLENELDAQAGKGSLTLAIFLAGFCSTPLVSGLVADRFGRRITLQVGLLCYSLAALACSLSTEFIELLVARAFQGAAAGACVAVPFSIVRESLPERAARTHIASLTAVVGLGPLIAPLLGGVIIDFWTWRMVHIVQALVGAAIWIGVCLTYKETLLPHLRKQISFSSAFIRCQAFLKNSVFSCSSIIYAACFTIMFVFITASPKIFYGDYPVTSLQFSLLICLISGAAFFGSLTTAAFSRRGWTDRRVMVIGCTGLLVSIAALVLQKTLGGITLVMLVICSSLTIYFFGLVSPAATHSALSTATEDRGTASGLVRTVQMLFSAGISMTLPLFFKVMSALSAALLLMSFCLALALIALIALIATTRLAPKVDGIGTVSEP